MINLLTKILILSFAIFIASFDVSDAAKNTVLDFDGTSDYVAVADKAVLDQANRLSLSVWIESDDAPTADEYILYRYNNYYLKINSSRNIIGGLNDSTERVTSSKAVTCDGNTWTHIEMTYDKDATGTDEIKLYINGVLDAVGDYSTAISASDKKLYFGAGDLAGDNTPENWFDGQIDGVQLYQYARSADNVLLDRNEGLATHLGPTEKTCSEDPASCTDYGLVGHWNMDEGTGTTAYDGSDNSNNGTLTGGPKWTTDSAPLQGGSGGGSALKFDGVNDYVDIVDSPELDNTTTMSWSFWIKSNDVVTSDLGMVTKYEAVNGERSWAIRNRGVAGEIDVGISSDGIAYEFKGSTSFGLQIGVITHVVITYDSGTVTWYKDGVFVETAENTQTSIFAGSHNVEIGKYRTNYFNGLIDDVRIYNRALSADEIRQLYNQKKPIFHAKIDEGSGTIAYDESFNNNDGTIYGAAGTADSGTTTTLTDAKTWTADEWTGETVTIHTGTCSTVSRIITDNDATSITVSDWDSCTPDTTSQYKITSKDEWTTGKFASAIDFDGVDDYVDVGSDASLNIVGDLTITAWIKTTNVTLADQYIYSNAKSTGNWNGWGFAFNRSSLGSAVGDLSFWVSDGDGAHYDWLHRVHGISDTDWHHVGVLWDDSAGTATFYVDGASIGTDTNAYGFNYTGAVYKHIGASCSLEYFFDGTIDDVRIYDYVRTADEIRLDYQRGLATHFN